MNGAVARGLGAVAGARRRRGAGDDRRPAAGPPRGRRRDPGRRAARPPRRCSCPRTRAPAPTRCCCARRARSRRAWAPARWRATWPWPPAAGWPSRRLERPRLALDIDTPRDLAALIARGGDCATRGGLRAPGGRRAPRRRERALRLWPLSALPEVRPGDDLAGMLAERARRPRASPPATCVVVAHKVVSKAEGRIVALAGVRPGPAARGAGRRDRQGGGPVRADPLREPAGGAPARGHGHLRDPPRLRLRQRRRRLLERARGGGGAAAGRPRRLGAPPPGADRGGGGGEGGAGGDRHPRARLPPRPGQRRDRGRRLRAGGRPPRRARPRRAGCWWRPTRPSPTSWPPPPGSTWARPPAPRRWSPRGSTPCPAPAGPAALVRDPAHDLFRT